jgi:hypothetical protein
VNGEGPYTILESDRFPRNLLYRLAFPRPRRTNVIIVLAAAVVAAYLAAVTHTLPYLLAEWLGCAVVLLVVGWFGIWFLRGLIAHRLRTLADSRDWPEWRQAVEARETILNSWRELRQHVEVGTDPRPVVDHAMWDLAGAILERARIRAARHELQEALKELPPGEPVVAELNARMLDLARAREQVAGDVARRLVHLTSLAESCADFLLDQAAIAHARAAVRAADAVLGEASARLGGDADAGRDLAERTRAVLSAYRDLQREVAGPII